mmetsp:Transcript_25593/g.35336  ORF Transcript_25593/g.35336 Transcript_25593/m.35336 type:complete len:342 (+) Transcript_25593:82-1107(+)|eukprot:CAMPEP_0196586092 /NCGR_PEP_ID=MMETSP1081-20130531/53087_1 /TAXON_ID=36882 /ORGANISM="Pyramimonas amylifera, Strain CCMP720" /LENGTH=341 /DNA_ID=CAMNT_0041907851 /DNA_START=62 /DNA_END=1087 /DNA_ORIENTATION=+
MAETKIPQTLEEAIPANVIMFSGCRDDQTSADVFNTASFELPPDSGPGGAGGACTNALLSSVYAQTELSWTDLLKSMHKILKEKNYSQVPQLSASRQLDLSTPWELKQPGSSGKTRALLIGINYIGTKAELKGCHNDVEQMKLYIKTKGFEEGENRMRVLVDDGFQTSPSYANITEGFKWLTEGAEAGDSLFLHYSGHGGNVADDNGDEKDGRDETLIPVDYESAGQIRDDVVFNDLVCRLPAGVHLTAIMDCCHSGTIFDLPYIFIASEDNLAAAEDQPAQMQQNPGFDIQYLCKVAMEAFTIMQSKGASAAAMHIAANINQEQKEQATKMLKGCGCIIA